MLDEHTIAQNLNDSRPFYVIAPCDDDEIPRVVGRFATFGEAHRYAIKCDKELATA